MVVASSWDPIAARQFVEIETAVEWDSALPAHCASGRRAKALPDGALVLGSLAGLAVASCGKRTAEHSSKAFRLWILWLLKIGSFASGIWWCYYPKL